METRNESFQKLKPVCIALSQTTLAFIANRRNANQVTQNLEQLLGSLNGVTTRPDSLDHKLADYVFFPISQVLKSSRDLPIQAMEACLQCLDILISKGWQNKMNSSLSGQLLIFLSLTCDTSGKTVPSHLATDELRSAGFHCLRSLFDSLNLTTAGKASLIETANVPSLGHAVSVILDGILIGESSNVQLAATEALNSLIDCIEDLEVLSSFFPGIISSLTKVLTPNTQVRRHWKVLALSLNIIDRLLKSLLANGVVSKIEVPLSTKNVIENEENRTSKLNGSWVKATAAQLKIALANINRIRSHDRPEVQENLLALNLTIVSDCSHALKDACTLALETLLLLIQDDSKLVYREKVAALAQADPSVSALLATVFHNEQLSLGRVMQTNDDQAKERALGKLFGAFQILNNTEVDASVISRMLASGLKDSVITILQDLSAWKNKTSRVTPIAIPQLSLTQNDEKSLTFSAPLAEYKTQETLLKYIQNSIRALKQSHTAVGLVSNLMTALRTSDTNAQTAVFWLILQDLQIGDSTGEDFLSDMLAGDVYSNNEPSSWREQLYSFSIDVLEDDIADWRLRTLALETVALQARHYGVDFRGELVDVLYPILYQLGSDSTVVRNHAMTCLNLVSDACQYSNVGDLVVSNVDYLVNAVTLKLNAFDVSPQGPQVLLMMVRLAGPSLLPYLEDTLESIFAALEDYHGYPALVELLFAVLRTMAEEGVKSPQLSIAYKEEVSRDSTGDWKPVGVAELLTIIRTLSRKSEERSQPPDQPKDGQADDSKDDQDIESESTEPTPPAPKTYALLLKITQLTQHYLSSSSPALRTSLLSLIRTTIPALAKHENSFLPLVNTLWPEVTSRLFDDEAHVVSGSLQIIATMCEYAGDFMRTRINSLWTELMSLHRRLSKEIKSDAPRKSGSGDLVSRGLDLGYVDTSTRGLWQQLEELLRVIIKHVHVDAEKFDDVLRLLSPVDELAEEVQAVLEDYNADAVWLARHRTRPCGLTTVQYSNFKFVQLAQ